MFHCICCSAVDEVHGLNFVVLNMATCWYGIWICMGRVMPLDFFHVDLEVLCVLIGTSETLHKETINENSSKMIQLQVRVPSVSLVFSSQLMKPACLSLPHSVSTPCATSVKTLSVLSHNAPPRTAYRYKLPGNRPRA